MSLKPKAIVSLVETSPFMSWLYTVFSVQGASNVIAGLMYYLQCYLVWVFY
ncbi:hypothetical protein ACOBV8_21470 (plasmid) [Pseudoalteromonas espejiana]